MAYHFWVKDAEVAGATNTYTWTITGANVSNLQKSASGDTVDFVVSSGYPLNVAVILSYSNCLTPIPMSWSIPF
ncbi:hypothetical protein [Mesoterricola silvestris]|uniref:Uncharacterized protein n=1 Tax=Mesoterricola silvestris TaxID=2927979 RepID=A0AA48GM35_9BACT|nr:hypothetical protein [Mesoterricola silvestris]BDU72344.1 hypothetical protein METEAL_15180 [Mesoterricola silvestris]